MFIPGNVSLFEGIPAAELESILGCLGVRDRRYRRGDAILREGDPVEMVAVVLAGSVQIERTDTAGNRMILASFGSGEVFAESIVCAGLERSPVSVFAVEDSSVLFIPFRRLIRPCGKTCAGHYRLVENMLKLLAGKNLVLSGKIEISGKRSIREKVLAYLSMERKKAGTSEFLIPFNRNELADFLCTDRSALSRELSRMRGEGLIGYEGNRFFLR